MTEAEDWIKLDSTLMREYHIRPWELDELTLPECSLMLLALSDREQGTVSKMGDDAFAQEAFEAKVKRLMEEAAAFNQLDTQERARVKLADAIKRYR